MHESSFEAYRRSKITKDKDDFKNYICVWNSLCDNFICENFIFKFIFDDSMYAWKLKNSLCKFIHCLNTPRNILLFAVYLTESNLPHSTRYPERSLNIAKGRDIRTDTLKIKSVVKPRDVRFQSLV